MSETTVREAPTVLRDMPMGPDGLKGRLLMIDPGCGRYAFVFYRGTKQSARKAIAACKVDELRDLFDRRQDVERRAGISPERDYALGKALDLPMIDEEVRRVAAYLDAVGS